MRSISSWILGVVLSIGFFFLLPVGTAYAQQSVQLDVTIESATLNSQTGEVLLYGTVTCAVPADGYIYVTLTQSAGRKTSVYGYANDTIHCDDDGDPFVLSIFPASGFFTTSGITVVEGYAYACDLYSCDDEEIREPVELKKISNP
jgi:hypothetical protein